MIRVNLTFRPEYLDPEIVLSADTWDYLYNQSIVKNVFVPPDTLLFHCYILFNSIDVNDPKIKAWVESLGSMVKHAEITSEPIGDPLTHIDTSWISLN